MMQRPDDQERFEAIARRESFAHWQGANRLGEDLLVWNYRITEDQLPRWRLQQAQSIEAPGWPRLLQSVWSWQERGLALFDVFECESRVEAHTLLVRLLAQVESARLERQEEPSAGDVMFGRGRAPVRLFARGNLVLFLRAAEREPVPIMDAAVRLDGELISKPEPPLDQLLPSIQRFSAQLDALRRGPVALEVSASDSRQESLWYKCFTTSGELRLSEGRPVYQHTSTGPVSVSLYAVAPGRGATRENLRVTSEPP